MWRDFLMEASRFDGRKLVALFGDADPVNRAELQRQLDARNLGDRNKKLIGEFVRRYHPRLAHEVAIYGMPGPTVERLGLKEIPEYVADLAGLVARSHGMSVRGCLGYRHARYQGCREYHSIHPVYLMALLRVADALQIEAHRAPGEALKVQSLQSPASLREWTAHHAIQDVRYSHDDPEAVFIHAEPRDVSIYLRVKNWLTGTQAELDASWAVIGEVYGRVNQFGLAVRRVRSNLDDEGRFAETVEYVSMHATFDTAGADLLKLLIGPLYGDRPEIGIRELLQNAVDAVRE